MKTLRLCFDTFSILIILFCTVFLFQMSSAIAIGAGLVVIGLVGRQVVRKGVVHGAGLSNVRFLF